MADQSTQSIVVDATPAEVMAVVADFAAYPEWTGAVKRTEVLDPGTGGRARRVGFSIDSGPIKDDYELAYTWDGDRKVEWDLVQGTMQKSQHGSYTLEADGGSTTVTYSLTVELAIPMLGMLKRKVEKVVMDTALKELKKRVESTG